MGINYVTIFTSHLEGATLNKAIRQEEKGVTMLYVLFSRVNYACTVFDKKSRSGSSSGKSFLRFEHDLVLVSQFYKLINKIAVQM